MPKVRTDSIPKEGIVQFEVVLDGGTPEVFPVSDAVDDPDVAGNVFFYYDVTKVSVGAHEIRLGADNGWEVTWSTPDPLSFTRPSPIVAFGISLVYG